MSHDDPSGTDPFEVIGPRASNPDDATEGLDSEGIRSDGEGAFEVIGDVPVPPPPTTDSVARPGSAGELVEVTGPAGEPVALAVDSKVTLGNIYDAAGQPRPAGKGAGPRGDVPSPFEFIGVEEPTAPKGGEVPGASTALVRVPGQRVKLWGLSSRAYEHPADRAALTALRKVPGVDAVLRTLIGLIGERSLRYLFLASAVRVNEHQFSQVYATYLEVCDTLDIRTPPELFVAQTPLVNAGAIGVDEPFIVLNSGTVALLSSDELRVVLGHELGHILSDHVLFKTLLRLLLNFSLANLGIPLGSIALFGLLAALREWDRKSELSCDRAGLLAVQDPRVAFTVHMKLAGGNDVAQMSVDEFIKQAHEYERAGSAVDGIFKLLNLIGRTHPFHVTRLAELKLWVEDGSYQKLLDGDYVKRAEEADASVYEEVKEGAKAYQEDLERSEEPLVRFFADLGNKLSEGGSKAVESAKGFFDRFSKKD